jgi:hypothetical protein
MSNGIIIGQSIWLEKPREAIKAMIADRNG